MAVDHALLEQVQRHGAAVLRLYTWQPACLSFGRNQPARATYDEAQVAAHGVDVVRRPTGGMAVLHDRELTYAVIAPFTAFGGPRAAYLTIHRALVAGLLHLGVPAALAEGPRRSAFGAAHPCFAEPAAGEVMVGGRKLIGSAQRCEQRVLLQHGSILLAGEQAEVNALARVPFSLENRVTSVERVIGRAPDPQEVGAAVARGFADVCGTSLAPVTAAPAVAERAAALETMYRSREWTWRR